MSELIITRFTEEDYHIPKPKPAIRDSQAWGLAMPAVAGIAGLCAFSILGLISPELKWLPDAFRTNTALVGAIGLAIGGEVGSLWTNVCVYRKVATNRVTAWDWSALVVSILATMLAFLLGMSTLMPEVVWSSFVSTWLRVGLIMVAALDQYAGQMELGLHLGTYDERVQEWEASYHAWLDKMASIYGPGATSTDTESSMIEDIPVKGIPAEDIPVKGIIEADVTAVDTPADISVVDVPGVVKAPTPLPRPLTEPIPPSELESPAELPLHCWCGRELRGDYEQHLTEVHGAEIVGFDTPAEARDWLRAKYQGVSTGGDFTGDFDPDFEFPSLGTVARLLGWAKAVNRWRREPSD